MGRNKRSFTVPACSYCKIRFGTNRPHRKGCRLGGDMGKKYDDYEKAVKAENLAKARLADVQGGATKNAMTEAVNNAKSAEAVSNVLFNEFIQDPEG